MAAPGRDATAPLIKAATYNVHGLVGRDACYDPPRIARVIAELAADIIALQEVQAPRHSGRELLQLLGAETGYTALGGPTLLRDEGQYGNVLLCRGEVERHEAIDLTFPGREPRSAINCLLSLHRRQLQVVATHLGLAPRERRHQVQHLIDQVLTPGQALIILMGDLNEWFLWGRPVKWLHRFFSRTPVRRTFPANFPLFALDRILVHPRRNLLGLEVHDSPLARAASDHLPLTATIRLS
ncbi:MAG: endonuclease/exonuclease/phosphatase family protein [Thermodesulfobacteriota bacterium]